MKNKLAKQMIADITMKGRSLYWYGEVTEVFVAHRSSDVKQEYDEECNDPNDMMCEKIKTNWKLLWKPCLSEGGIGGAKQNENGFYIVPTISAIPKCQGDNSVSQVFTDYN